MSNIRISEYPVNVNTQYKQCFHIRISLYNQDKAAVIKYQDYLCLD